MTKVFAFALAACALAAVASQANAGRHRGCCPPAPCCQAAPSCCDGAAAPAAAATDHAANNNTAQPPQSNRSFSYQPSTSNTYSAAPNGANMNRGRIINSYGLRPAGAKDNGNY